MSAYFSGLLTQTTSKYNSIRRTLLSNEEDGDTEDDSHISRALRTYYTEKGRPFPPWLPPDPNDKRNITPSPYAPSTSSYFNTTSKPPTIQSQASSRSSLSDLWDPPSAGSNGPAGPPSLRNARRPGAMAAAVRPTSNPGGMLTPPLPARPLPSQRTGSYQSVLSRQSDEPGGADITPPPSSGSGGGGTAQDRLKARLWGGGRPASSGAAGSADQMQYGQQGGGDNRFDVSRSNRRYGQMR